MSSSVRWRVAQGAAAFVYAFGLFAFNVWSMATPAWFHGHQTVSDDLVWARLQRPASPALDTPPFLYRPVVQPRCDVDIAQVRSDMVFPASLFEAAWLYAPSCIDATTPTPYLSQLGLQGFAAERVFRRISAQLASMERPGGRADTVLAYGLQAMRLLQSALAAGAVTLIMLWVAQELGVGAYLVTLLSLSISPWLAVFGKSVYWQLWLLLLPFALSAWACRARAQAPRPRRLAVTCLWWLAIVVVFALKSAMGYEYLSTLAISCLVPMVYYGLATARPVKGIAAEAGCILGLAIVGFAMAVWLHAAYAGHGDWSAGLEIVRERAAARTYATTQDGQASWLMNLAVYVFGVQTYRGAFVPFGVLLVLFFWCARRRDRADGRHTATVTLLVAAAAPVSWFVLARGHSAVHTHLNYLLWHIPLTWIGWALVGEQLQRWVVARGFTWKKAEHEQAHG